MHQRHRQLDQMKGGRVTRPRQVCGHQPAAVPMDQSRPTPRTSVGTAAGAAVALTATDRGAASAHACAQTPFIAGCFDVLSPWDSRDNGEFRGIGAAQRVVPREALPRDQQTRAPCGNAHTRRATPSPCWCVGGRIAYHEGRDNKNTSRSRAPREDGHDNH